MTPSQDKSFSPELVMNLDKIKSELGNSQDVIIREFQLGGKLDAAIIFTDGLSDQNIISNSLMRSLLNLQDEALIQTAMDNGSNQIIQMVTEQLLTFGEIKEVSDWDQLFIYLLSGCSILLFNNCDRAISAATKGGETRGVTETSTQSVVRGPKEAFSESIRTNTALIRRKIKSPKLWLEQRVIGDVTQTEVDIMFIKGIANEKIVQEVRDRLDRIKIDGILESGYIEDLIQDEVWTPFPTVFNSERPDTIAAGLLEGRIAILTDGTPFVLLVPVEFVSFLQSAEDYYQRYDIGTFLRLLRFGSFFIALLLPSLYVAIATFHQEIIPTSLLLHLAAQREGVPFPPIVEAFLMEIVFEVLREAGIRMPSAVGKTISIVGALVIGQSAVEAGIVSPAMVIIVSFTAITNFVIPAFSLAIAVRLLRFGFLILAGTLGMYGIAVALICLVLHLCSLRSFGIPYLKPFAPFMANEQKDAILRSPIWAMNKRPQFVSQDSTRLGKKQKPKKPPGDKPRNGGES
ncbi:spore germination protein [Paenibacillus psychroresistens]|uniref:Spore germination protein n=1 Tax=Paenibacillus psychroresistens TaxID=1778678 RepID=A0A6B8RQX1_9BACL|nr:spore germination protein [Paenibacillus psychroresistens]QGQ97883.1 spore germination protein [Paenibacillus psychroresistens]